MYWLTKYFPKYFPKIASLRRSLSTIGIGAFCVIGTSLSISTPAESRYIVFVRGNNPTTLQKIRSIVPTAFITRLPQLSNQTVTQVGAFNQESSADRLISTLSSRGIASDKLFRSETGKDDPTATDPANQPVDNTADPNSSDTTGSDSAATDGNDTQAAPVADGSDTNNPDNIEINRPADQPQGLPTNAVAAPPATSTTSPPQQVAVPPTQFPARFPVAANCNCQADPNGLGTVSTVTIPESNISDSSANASANYRYVAAVPTQGNPQFLLNRVQQFLPAAKLMNSWRGSYVHAGAYPNRDAAESVSRFLRSKGIDSRVLFF